MSWHGSCIYMGRSGAGGVRGFFGAKFADLRPLMRRFGELARFLLCIIEGIRVPEMVFFQLCKAF